MQVRFGAFTFDADRRLLMRGQVPVHLGPKAFDLLQMLIERRPKVVSKAVLMEHLWPRTFVAENGLATLINDLRTALDDPARAPRIIRTAHGVGYAFVATAEATRSADSGSGAVRQTSDWFLVWDQTTLPLLTGENIIGRPSPGVIGLDAPTVSRQHARLIVDGGQVTVEDLGSKNGTWIGSTKVTTTSTVSHGQEIRFGLALVRLVRSVNPASTKTAQIEARDQPEDISRNS